MPRIRTFKAELFIDEKVCECSVDARYCFLGLFPFVDDLGRRQYSPKRIKGEVFPCDEDITWQVVEALIQELAKVGLVELYEIGKQRYLRIPNFLRHQIINRPSHSSVPPAPSEGEDPPRCSCPKCKSKNGNRRTTFPQELIEHSLSTHGGLTEPSLTHGVLTESSVNTHAGVERKGVERSKSNTNTNTENANSTAQYTSAKASEEHRRTQIEALDRIALRMLRTLDLSPNHLLQQALTRSLIYRAKSKNCTVELAAQQILARAAYLVAESPPDNWLQWFEDVGYEYVPEGDKRLDDKRIEARPVCGGSSCEEGWERVKVGGAAVLRRCPDCAKLWEE